MYKFNRKGFTLIELLVCITILGIITAMSIPIIRNITANNSNTKYASYLDTVVNAAKLYVDAYGEDLFGNYATGCNYVTYQDLKEKNLIKDYNSDGMTCDTTSTFVEVTKFEDSYSYKGFLGCANKTSPDKIVYSLPNKGHPNEQDPATCAGIDVATTIRVAVDPLSSNSYDKKSLNVKIKAYGRSGIKRDLRLMYKWSTSSSDFSPSGMQTASFSIPTEATQKGDLNAGRQISIESSNISTPLGESGKLYLIVFSENLRDFYDNYWVYNDSSYATFGPFVVDNKPPVIDGSSAIISSDSRYNNDKPKLSISSVDDLTPTSNLKMCVSFNDYCSDWEPFDGTKSLGTIAGFKYDGTGYDVYVTIADAANNETRKKFTYYSYTHCTHKVPDGEWIGSCPPCGTNVEITQTRRTKDSYLGTACPDESRQYACSLNGCCTSVKTECTAWGEYSACSKECCIGTKSRTRSCRYVSNYDNSDCGEVTDLSILKQTVQCNQQACAPYLNMDNVVGLLSYSCNTNDVYAGSRTCNLVWNPNPAETPRISYMAYRSPSFGESTWLVWGKHNSQTDPYCNWIKSNECGGFPANGLYRVRLNQNDYNLEGGIVDFNSTQ